MNTQTDTTIVNPMQVTEAFPLEDRSLPANETLKEQLSEVAEKDSAPIFVP